MTRHAPRLSVAIALLLSLQWASAFAHCLAPLAAGGHAVEICTADGRRLLVLGEDGQPAAPVPQGHDSCPLCPGSAAPAAEPPGLPAISLRYAPAAPPHPAGLPPSPARAPPQQPRAPPIA